MPDLKPIILEVVGDIVETIPRECPSIRGAYHDQSWDPGKAPKLPWSWAAGYAGGFAPDGTNDILCTLLVLVQTAFRFTDRAGETCRETGMLLLCEIIPGLYRDIGRGMGPDNARRAVNTRVETFSINPDPQFDDVGILTTNVEVDCRFKRLDPRRQ